MHAVLYTCQHTYTDTPSTHMRAHTHVHTQAHTHTRTHSFFRLGVSINVSHTRARTHSHTHTRIQEEVGAFVDELDVHRFAVDGRLPLRRTAYELAARCCWVSVYGMGIQGVIVCVCVFVCAHTVCACLRMCTRAPREVEGCVCVHEWMCVQRAHVDAVHTCTHMLML